MSTHFKPMDGLPTVFLAEDSEVNGRITISVDSKWVLSLTRDEVAKLAKELLSWAYSVEAEVELDKMTFKKKGT